MLPAKFVRNFKTHRSDSVTLEVPDGRTWIVGLEKHAKKLWLVSGLRDFFRFYSISPGQIILFKYIDSNRLKVFICSSSSMEITYPEPEIESPDSEVWKKLNSSPIIVSTRFSSTFWNASAATKMAIGRAVDSNPSNLSAMVIIAKYSSTGGMTLPVRFTQRWGVKHLERSTLKLYSEGSSDEWVGEWVVCMSEISMPNRMSINGWHRFRDDNMVGVGDVCLFELVQPEEGEEFIGVRVFKGADR
ncbi:B3 domain-containing transcription factor VRN1 [Linum perenne]